MDLGGHAWSGAGLGEQHSVYQFKSMTDTTTISLTTDMRDRLFDRKRNSAETYEDVIDRLLAETSN